MKVVIGSCHALLLSCFKAIVLFHIYNQSDCDCVPIHLNKFISQMISPISDTQKYPYL
jgi:hypothetical protein